MKTAKERFYIAWPIIATHAAANNLGDWIEKEIEAAKEASFKDGYTFGIEDEHKAWLDGKRCESCGNDTKGSATSDTCMQCWEEA